MSTPVGSWRFGGERGGAHGNVRWSVWDGTASGVAEKPQGFSTFGGYGAGDMTAAVITPAGAALVGSWNSEQTGLDVAVWTADGDTWTGRSSAGTALESIQAALGFPMAASVLGQGVLVTGRQPAERIRPVVWQSTKGVDGFAKTALPDAGSSGSTISAACQGSTCGVAGQVDGRLAVWRLVDGTWTRLAGAPPIPVGDKDQLPAPLEIDARWMQLVSEGGQVKIAPPGTRNPWPARCPTRNPLVAAHHGGPRRGAGGGVVGGADDTGADEVVVAGATEGLDVGLGAPAESGHHADRT